MNLGKKSIDCYLRLQLMFALLAVSSAAFCDESDVDTNTRTRFFESKVRPLLIDNCVRCHGEEKQEGGLRLDSQTAFTKGGENGPVVDASAIGDSLILNAIHYKDLEMPPSGKLSEEKIQVFERWVTEGSYWPPKMELNSSTKSGPRYIIGSNASIISYIEPASARPTKTVVFDDICTAIFKFYCQIFCIWAFDNLRSSVSLEESI